MSAAVQQLLDSFDALPEADKHQVAVEILRRFGGAGAGDLPEEALTGAADELFRALDLADERRWEEHFAHSQDQLARVTAKVREDIRAGRVKSGGFDQL